MRKTLKRNLAYDDRNHLYYVSLYYDGENGRRVRRTRTYQTMEQAEQVIADYRRAQLLGGKSAPRDVSMEDWLRYWMREIITPNCAETTRHGYENILYTHMIPTLGKVHAQELTAMRVQQYYGELRKKGLANNTIRKHHVLLHAALGAAVRQGQIWSRRPRVKRPGTVFTIHRSCGNFFARARDRSLRSPLSLRAVSGCGAAKSAGSSGAMSIWNGACLRSARCARR